MNSYEKNIYKKYIHILFIKFPPKKWYKFSPEKLNLNGHIKRQRYFNGYN